MADKEKGSKGVSRRKFLVRGGLGTVGVLAIGTYIFRNSIRRELLGIRYRWKYFYIRTMATT